MTHPVEIPGRREAGGITTIGGLTGRLCRVEALDPLRHGEDLWREFADDEHSGPISASGPFADRIRWTTPLSSDGGLAWSTS
jgi:hypothetical protein